MRHVPPVLAVEVGGEAEDEAQLRDKARWCLTHGVGVVWLILSESREVLVFDAAGIETHHRRGVQLRKHASLPGLAPGVDGFFAQLDRRP